MTQTIVEWVLYALCFAVLWKLAYDEGRLRGQRDAENKADERINKFISERHGANINPGPTYPKPPAPPPPPPVRPGSTWFKQCVVKPDAEEETEYGPLLGGRMPARRNPPPAPPAPATRYLKDSPVREYPPPTKSRR